MMHSEMVGYLMDRKDIYPTVADLAKELKSEIITLYKWRDGTRNPIRSNQYLIETLYKKVVKNDPWKELETAG